jgi:hypothetical protein
LRLAETAVDIIDYRHLSPLRCGSPQREPLDLMGSGGPVDLRTRGPERFLDCLLAALFTSC